MSAAARLPDTLAKLRDRATADAGNAPVAGAVPVFGGGGFTLALLDAANLTGTVAAARLPATAARTDADSNFLVGQTIGGDLTLLASVATGATTGRRINFYRSDGFNPSVIEQKHNGGSSGSLVFWVAGLDGTLGESLRLNYTKSVLVNGSTDDGVSALQVGGAGRFTGDVVSAGLVKAKGTTYTRGLCVQSDGGGAGTDTANLYYDGGANAVAVQSWAAKPLALNPNGNRVSFGYLGAGRLATVRAAAPLDFLSVAAGATAELTVSVTGAVVGGVVSLGPPASLEAGLVAFGRVSAADTVTVRLLNTTGSAIDPASATWAAEVTNY